MSSNEGNKSITTQPNSTLILPQQLSESDQKYQKITKEKN